jgi:hypothetical protein
MADQTKVDSDLKDRVMRIVARHEAEAKRRRDLRKQIEERWLANEAQRNGRYWEETTSQLVGRAVPGATTTKSKLFINETRPKCDAWSGWLQDLLFPTDDKNWSVGPTPVPHLTRAADAAAKLHQQIKDQLIAQGQQQLAQPAGGAPDQGGAPAQPAPPPQPAGPAGPAAGPTAQDLRDAEQAKKELQAQIDEARERSELMEQEIDDQLKECDYLTVKRDQIEDAINYGTGVTKGPVTGEATRQGWKQKPAVYPDDHEQAGQPILDANGQQILGNDWELVMSGGDRPGMRHVSLWSFYPDPDVAKISDGEGVYELHLFGAKRVRALQHLPGFDKDALRRLLKQKPADPAPSYLQALRNINDKQTHLTGEFYHVWEYTGCLSTEDIKDIAMYLGDQATVDDMEETDPLIEVEGCLWFSQGVPLKFSIYPYDSGECMYSVFNFVKDPTSIFGFGVPDMIRDPQRSLNAAWRAMMDNAAYAVGPQIGIKKDKVQPENGEWKIGGGPKVWVVDPSIQDIRQAISSFDIPINQVEYANIIALSKQFIDNQSEMPQMGQGEQGIGVTQTAQGMALLMNSNNIMKRRVVRNYDDDVTKPDLRRFYDWNMQFNTKEEIKGDYEVDARGSSVLLMRELQSQTLFAICIQLGAHPVFGPMLKNRDLLRMLFRSLGIMPGDVVLSDDEIDLILEKAAASRDAEADKAAVDMQKVQVQAAKVQVDAKKADDAAQIATMNIETEKARLDQQERIAVLQHEREIMKMANQRQISIDALLADLRKTRIQTDSHERIFAGEVAVQRQENEKDRASSLEETKAAAAAKTTPANETRPGSGGYV